MCNSSFHTNLSVFNFKQFLEWNCLCHGQFAPYVINVITAIFFVLGLPISCVSLWIVFRKKFTANLVLALNITVLELIFNILSLLDLILSHSITLPNYLLIVFFVGLHWTVRPILQICMCMEHYLAVIHPVMFLKYKSIHYRNALATVAWIIALSNSLRLILSEEPIFPDYIFFMFFCFAFTIISFCCLSVLHALRHPRPGDRPNVEVTEKVNITDRTRAVENRQKRKAFRIISHTLLSIFICYLPQGVAYFLTISEINSKTYICEIFPVILCVTMVTVLLSPLMKMHSEGQLKNVVSCNFEGKYDT